MSVTLTVVVATADQPRLQAALAAGGISDPGALIAGRINEIIRDHEAALAAAHASTAYQAAVDAQAATYTPITPTVTVTPGP